MGNEVEELKPCPFCPNGGKPWVWKSHDPKASNRIVWCIACESCACEGPEAATESEAAECWNTRASTPSPLTAEQAKERAALVLDTVNFDPARHRSVREATVERIASELMTPSVSVGEADGDLIDRGAARIAISRHHRRGVGMSFRIRVVVIAVIMAWMLGVWRRTPVKVVTVVAPPQAHVVYASVPCSTLAAVTSRTALTGTTTTVALATAATTAALASTTTPTTPINAER